MGFLLPDRGEAYKQHLNLSDSAWLVVEDDINVFGNGAKYNLAGFLNRVVLFFLHDADASIGERVESRREELRAVFSSEEFGKADPAVTEKYVGALLSAYKKELIDKVRSYPKGMGRKFNLQEDVKDALLDSAENEYYEIESGLGLGVYLKAILKEYAAKPAFERELIYFKSVVDKIKLAMVGKKKLKIALIPKLDPGTNAAVATKLYFSPYKIIQDQTRSYNYLIGHSEIINEDGTTQKPVVASLRISRIDRISVMSSKGKCLNAEERNEMDEMLREKDVRFLVGDVQTFTVRFTEKGLESFNRLLYLRPRTYEEVPDEPLTYRFRCTEMQLISYFFKFGRDAEILSPAETREKSSENTANPTCFTAPPQISSDLKREQKTSQTSALPLFRNQRFVCLFVFKPCAVW